MTNQTSDNLDVVEVPKKLLHQFRTKHIAILDIEHHYQRRLPLPAHAKLSLAYLKSGSIFVYLIYPEKPVFLPPPLTRK